MTIIEAALQRAKRLGNTNSVHVTRKRSSESILTMPMVRLDLPRQEADARACVANRILIAQDRDRYSTVADAYRMIRARLLHRIEAQGWNSIAVTSAGPGEGKSVTVLNLGLTLANEKKRNVFLLDLDLRNPSLCQYLGVRAPVGIGDYLAGTGKLEEIFFNVGSANLVVAGGYTSHENSTELLGGERLGELLSYIWKLDPNAVIIADLPPVLSVADAIVVAPKLSATMLVVAEGKTHREGLSRALAALSGVKMAGIVLNQSREVVENYYG